MSCIFESYDHESGIESIKFQVYEKKNGHRRKIWPGKTCVNTNENDSV